MKRLSESMGISAKSVSRAIGDLKAFLADHRDLVGNTEMLYENGSRCYRLRMDEFLTDQELFALIEVMIGVRAFSRMELLALVGKLERFAIPENRQRMKDLIRRELFRYCEVKHDCKSVQETLWKLAECIERRKEITVSYFRVDRARVEHRIRPASVMFADHYFYLIAFKADDLQKPVYFRVDRIVGITEHRSKFLADGVPDFDEGLLRQRSLFMWPGKLRTIRFEFTGPSIQAVLDKLPTAKVIERNGGEYLVEAEVYGDGIRMWLLSQGPWVRVVAPDDFVEEMKKTLDEMRKNYPCCLDGDT